MRRRLALALLVVAIAILWRPLIRPVGSGAILVADIYSSALWDRNVAEYVTPLPQVTGAREAFGGIELLVTWWRARGVLRHRHVPRERGHEDAARRRPAGAVGSGRGGTPSVAARRCGRGHRSARPHAPGGRAPGSRWANRKRSAGPDRYRSGISLACARG